MTRIEGVNAAAITPHGAGGREPDFGALLDLIDFLSRAGARGIALLGSTGEFLNLDIGERTRLVYLATKRSRVPVLAGVGHASLEGALELGREACSAGAAGLLLMPPVFFPYGQAEVREFYLQYARQIGAAVPIYLYNIPFFTTEIAVETAIELLSTGLFAGIKDSSGSFEYFERLKHLAAPKPFTVLVGNDAVFARARAAGADGVVSGIASALPELLLALDAAIACGDGPRAARLDARLHEFIAWCDRFPTPTAIKVALAVRGIKPGPPSVPLASETRRRLEEFQEWFKTWLADVLKEAARA